MLTRILAAVCGVCPLCLVSRRWPGSRFARAKRPLDRVCPFCRARARLKGPAAPRR